MFLFCRKSATPLGRGDSPVAAGGTPALSQHGTPLLVAQDRPVSKQSSPAPSRVESAVSQARMINDNVRVSPTPSLKSDLLPDLPDSGQFMNGDPDL